METPKPVSEAKSSATDTKNFQPLQASPQDVSRQMHRTASQQSRVYRKQQSKNNDLYVNPVLRKAGEKTKEVEDIARKKGHSENVYENVPTNGLVHASSSHPTITPKAFRKEIQTHDHASFKQQVQQLSLPAYITQEPTTDIEIPNAQEVAIQTRFNSTIALWMVLFKLFIKNGKAAHPSDTFFEVISVKPLDPLSLGMVDSSTIYAHPTEIEIQDYSQCSLSDLNINAYGKLAPGGRRDTKYIIPLGITCADLEVTVPHVLKSDTSPLKEEENKTTKIGLLRLKFTNFFTNMNFFLTEINEKFVQGDFRYKPLEMTLYYTLDNIEILKYNEAEENPFPGVDVRQLFETYIKTIKDNPKEIAKHLIESYLDRVNPHIIRLKWIHQLPEFLLSVFSNEKSIKEYTKLQTRLMEVFFFILRDPKIYKLMETVGKTASVDVFGKLLYFRTLPEYLKVNTYNYLSHPSLEVDNITKYQEQEAFHKRVKYILKAESQKVVRYKTKEITKMMHSVIHFFCEALSDDNTDEYRSCYEEC